MPRRGSTTIIRASARGVYMQVINGVSKPFDFPAHILKDTREKLQVWHRQLRTYPEIRSAIDVAMAEIKLLKHADLDASSEAKPLSWSFKGAPVPLNVKIWRAK